jgi:hypothetical protein
MRWMFRKYLKFSGLLTSHLRLMPHFIIIGAQRCGTTSLYNYLVQHPFVAPALEKEVHFFDNNFKKGIIWYRSHFSSFLYKYYFKQVHKRDFVTGESTPYYLFHPHVPKRIFCTIPQIKLLVLLRNPVDRAYSHYHHERRLGIETLSFKQAIKKEKQRLAGELDKIIKDENYYSFNHQHYSYLSRGIYLDQMKLWMSLFSKEQILILRSESFYENPSTVYKKALKFLDLPLWEFGNYKKYNVGRYQNMGTALRKRLVNYFEPHNQRLYKYLGTNFNWDK